MAMISKGYRCPRLQIPSLTNNGWEKDNIINISPTKCIELPASEAVIELVKCNCRGSCTINSKCSCQQNCLPCTALCKYSDCSNLERYSINQEDDGE